MHHVVYNNKLKHKCTLIPLDPRLFYVSAIQDKRHLSFRDTCPDLYNYLSVPCVLCLAACSAVEHLSVLYGIRQLALHTIQCWSASISYKSAFCVSHIVFILFGNHIYLNYMVSQHI